jgi:hypothetical protein
VTWKGLPNTVPPAAAKLQVSKPSAKVCILRQLKHMNIEKTAIRDFMICLRKESISSGLCIKSGQKKPT